MERKIGEEFDYNGVKLKVKKGYCNKECFFFDGCTRVKVYPVCGECVSYFRIDNEYVRFIRIEDKIEMKEETKTIEIPEGWEFDKVNDGKIFLKEKKKELPMDWCNCLFLFDKNDLIKLPEILGFCVQKELSKPLLKFCQLLICRNAWWSILNYKPNWFDHNEKKYCIHAIDGYVTWSTNSQFPRVLAFPTQEVCEEFKKSFKDLIEEAKELL